MPDDRPIEERTYPNRWGPEFDGSKCGSCGHNTNGDMMDSDRCAEVGCDGNYSSWIPPGSINGGNNHDKVLGF